MEYRQLPHGSKEERLGVLGLGMGGIQKCSDDEIERIIRTAIAGGINFLIFAQAEKMCTCHSDAPLPARGIKCFSNFTSVRFTTKKANTDGREICS